MKRKYTAPSTILVKAETEGAMLQDSKFNDQLDNTGVNSGAITSKNHRPGSLWDESWEDEEEDD